MPPSAALAVATKLTVVASTSSLTTVTARTEDGTLQAEEIVVKAGTTGQYVYFCSVRGHAKGGMWGNIAVGVEPGANVKPPEKIEHVHTAGNSSGIVDGAAVVLQASADYVKAHSLKPRARIRATATYGTEPVIMLTAPTPASKKALALAGMEPGDIDLWEINEAFAAIPLQTARNLSIDPERINVNGGAIALGHPLGATGACLIGTAVDELERANKSTALITLCIGGGMGVATIIERV